MKNIYGEVPWRILFTDDLLLDREGLEKVENRLEEWRKSLEI